MLDHALLTLSSRCVQNRQLDPELSNSFIDPDISNLAGYLCYLSSVPFWLDRTVTTLRHALLGVRGVLPAEFYIRTPEAKEAVVRYDIYYMCITDRAECDGIIVPG